MLVFIAPVFKPISILATQTNPAIKFSYFFTEKTIIFVLNYFILRIFIVIFILNIVKSPLKLKITYDFAKNTPTYLNNKLLFNWPSSSI
jgi:hypothetical protein